MKKKITILFLTIALFNCKTLIVDENSVDSKTTIIDKRIIIEEKQDSDKIRQALSDNIMANSEIYYGDFAALILDLIKNKKWEILVTLTDNNFYNSYVIENNGSIIDYSMFMLHTGHKGISTNNSINDIENAFFTDNYKKENKNIFEGIYLYNTGETEFFKLIIEESSDGLLLTRE